MITSESPAGLGIGLYPTPMHPHEVHHRHSIAQDVSVGTSGLPISDSGVGDPVFGPTSTTAILQGRAYASLRGASPCKRAQAQRCQQGPPSLGRTDTLLSLGASPARNAEQLGSLLGNSSSRLRTGAIIPPRDSPTAGKKKKRLQQDIITLEQAKHRARVEVDIILESDTYVQGDYLRGHIKLNVRKRSKKEVPVSIAEGKIRVVGFETVPNEDDRYTFYQCAAPLSTITDNVQGVYASAPDPEGYAQAVEGVHVLPFAMHIPTDGTFGSPKGVVSLPSGVAVRYIAMISVKVKDPKTDKRSIAHFYRSCEIWPRLNPSVALAAAPRPIQASTSKSVAVVGSGAKVKLTALLHRLTWVAGQRCYVKLAVANDTKKTLKNLSLTLVRTTTGFKPNFTADADGDVTQKSTTHRPVAESVLEIAHQGAKGHASAKGWWTGVSPGQELEFSHYILLPPDAVSITRGRLLEVEYSIRVALSTGPLTPDVSVMLPVKIINFLSIDPTPCLPLLSQDGSYTRLVQHRRSIDGELASDGSSSHSGLSGITSHNHRRHPDERPPPGTSRGLDKPEDGSHQPQLRITNPDAASPLPGTSASASSDSSRFSSSSTGASTGTTHVPLGNLELDDPDSDEEVGAVLEQTRTRPASPEAPRGRSTTAVRWGAHTVAERGKRGRSRFAQRVQEKLAAAAKAEMDPERFCGDFTPRLRHLDSASSADDAPRHRRATWLSATLPRPLRRATNMTQLTDVTASYSLGSRQGSAGGDSSAEGFINTYLDRAGASSPSSVYSVASDPCAPTSGSSSNSVQLERPTVAMRQTGSSSNSVVRSRIAELERILQDP
ncbi:hypothetical protein CERSUDRAFT_70407 [Gelatoporia subvermispora B]|uniref:Arrestin C-terminal-like domain-containing protein n=1 Tax=Ceriporiopsis subvermispora (strain B) TaxID=914234 RepID=M2RU51_CERS8|nr:hypothetical protein CERSUDRAFT_70407 [Gelatoporia subvermispora B]